LFLDEPTTGVDPVSRKEFWAMLKKLKEQGITILVSTPYMDEASLCERVALIQQGKILIIDTPNSIANAYPRKLYAVESDNKYQLLIQLRNNPVVHSAYIFGELLHVTFKEDLRMGEEQDFQFSSFDFQLTEIMPSIEDCFIELLRK
jgi:ABC-type multidrug transport system ATPase subunit